MVFLPDKMKRQRTGVVSNSDEDDESLDTDLEDDLNERSSSDVGQAHQEDKQDTTKTIRQKGRKRNSSITHEEQNSETEDSIIHTSKRHCKTVSSKSYRRTRRVNAEPNDELDRANTVDRGRAKKRQSTMTQLVDGRRPLPGVKELEFKPVKRSARLSWSGKNKSGKGSTDGKQRTLTQMVPGMRKLEAMSHENLDEGVSDVEAEDSDGQAYGDAVAHRLARQGLYQTEDGRGEVPTSGQVEEGMNSASSKNKDPRADFETVEDDCEKTYKPTQFIEALPRRSERTNRRNAKAQKSKKSNKARFSLLSTPEKRRIREIPSSQSPADSPLSIRVTPYKSNRSPLKECSGYSINASETPSKRKQVTFKTLSKTPIQPPKLKRFESTIQDSEDEDEDIIEEDASSTEQPGQIPNNNLRGVKPRKDDSGYPRLLLDRTDRAGGDATGTSHTAWPESPQESESLPELRGTNKPSPELGEPHMQPKGQQKQDVREEHSAQDDGLIKIKQEPESEDEDNEDFPEVPAVLLPFSHQQSPVEGDIAIKTEPEQYRSSPPVPGADSQDTFPSMPMVIKHDPADEDNRPEEDTTPNWTGQPRPHSTATNIQQSADLDGELIQVPRSPSLQHESQQSHTSKAEQQLQDEWLSYSQYVHTRLSESSSVRAVPDAHSYNATPRPRQAPAADRLPQHQPSCYGPSQATTIDEITQRTPRKQRAQHFSSTHTTPHRIASSQPVISPSKPPPLFIPSSFPSPEKAGMEGWSSPVTSMTPAAGGCKSSQWASLEDFSIPLPPPTHEDDDDDEER